jgi:hypothetical protein
MTCPRRPAHLLALACLLLVPSGAHGQGRAITLDDLYHPERRIDFSGSAPTGLVWMSDTHYLWPKPLDDEESVEWMKVDAASGTAEPLFDAARMRNGFDALPGLRATDVARLPNRRTLEMNAARTTAVVSAGDDLYYYQFGAERAVRLTFDPYPEEEFTFSPDGRLVSLQPSRPQRQARLGVPGRDLRPRQLSRLLALRQPLGQRQGRAIGLDQLQKFRRAGAERHRGPGSRT